MEVSSVAVPQWLRASQLEVECSERMLSFLLLAIPQNIRAQARMGFGQPAAQRQPLEQPTPAPIPEDTGNPNQGIILAAILGGSAILGIATGCLLFRKKGSNGDSDDDMDSDDSDDSSSDDSD